MKRRFPILGLLLLLSLLLSGPVWAEDGCCCGTSENICEPPTGLLNKRPSLVELWTRLQSKAEQLRLASSAVAIAKSACAPSSLQPSSAMEDCLCWQARDPAPSRLPAMALAPFFHAVEPLEFTIVLPTRARVIAKARKPLVLPASRPPIELEGWSHALLPLPPPFPA